MIEPPDGATELDVLQAFRLIDSKLAAGPTPHVVARLAHPPRR